MVVDGFEVGVWFVACFIAAFGLEAGGFGVVEGGLRFDGFGGILK